VAQQPRDSNPAGRAPQTTHVNRFTLSGAVLSVKPRLSHPTSVRTTLALRGRQLALPRHAHVGTQPPP
jgi:hypothetical protein